MPAAEETTQFRVSGMTCSGCASRVTRVLERLEGVREAQVTLEEETARVDFDGSRVDSETMEQAIEKAGYEAEEK